MVKQYQKKIIRIISFLLVAVLISMTAIFLCACNTDPNTLDVWYLSSFTVGEQRGYVRGIYNQEYVSSEYMTISFKDGKVEFNRNGETIKGTYTYKDNIGCGSEKYDNNEVVVYLENGVAYKGSSHVYMFDGSWYELELKNETEELYFCDNRDDYSLRQYLGVDTEAYTIIQDIKEYQEVFPNSDRIYSYRIALGEQEKIIEDKTLADKFLEKISEQVAYNYAGEFDEENLNLENNFYKYNFEISDNLYGEFFQLTFYYNSETDFFIKK